ncbi:MAG TPA: CpaD family pilus assembly protein [Bradyrhizobium sp.]|uniref:CpaD family pilus assembly protein n=1 Tax=Bradyrhizobium sp. TaxID=376 RepID=UPI002D068CBB|nr:CpaD family pilus assembly protein [Bradyrhizobium sp.]HTB04007.1 CpaD family pilus assembly protein [Bradyrhizobium sp.]
MTNRIAVDRQRNLRLLGALFGLSAALGGCNYTSGEVATASIPDDYRLRHPIAIEEADRSVVIFVGEGRGGLSAAQRNDVIGLAHTWVSEGTGAVVIDVPIDTPNARAAAATSREAQGVLEAGGVPARAISVHRYHPNNPRTFATIRLTYPRIAAVAGPCGVWPEDLGPSIMNERYFENKEYYNFGCAYQRDMAAMVANPADLVQPRSETPPYTARRSEAFEKYRKGEPTSTVYPEGEKAKLSEAGK